MSYLGTIANVWEGLLTAGKSAEAIELRQKAEALLTEYAEKLAEATGVQSYEANMEPQDFSGLLVAFAPKHKGQEIPKALEGFDSADEWHGEDDEDEGEE